MSLGVYLRMWEQGGSQVDLSPEDEPRVDAAVSRYIDSGGNLDSVMDLTTINGASYRALASTVLSWMISTPETRFRSTELERLGKDEEREHRSALGLPWNEDA